MFQVHGVDGEGRAEVRRKLRRGEVIGFFEAQPACTVELEACRAAHHWGRVLAGLGHTVRLVPPETVGPFVKALGAAFAAPPFGTDRCAMAQERRGRRRGAVRGRAAPEREVRAGEGP